MDHNITLWSKLYRSLQIFTHVLSSDNSRSIFSSHLNLTPQHSDWLVPMAPCFGISKTIVWHKKNDIFFENQTKQYDHGKFTMTIDVLQFTELISKGFLRIWRSKVPFGKLEECVIVAGSCMRHSWGTRFKPQQKSEPSTSMSRDVHLGILLAV